MRDTLTSKAKYSMCSRKARFKTYDEADRYARRHQMPAYYVYDCPICNGWHITGHGSSHNTTELRIVSDKEQDNSI